MFQIFFFQKNISKNKIFLSLNQIFILFSENQENKNLSFSLQKQHKNKGQVTVEYILLAVSLLILFQIATNTLKNNRYLKAFQETPQNIFQSLVENGNWDINKDSSRKKHPNHYEAQYTTDGTGPSTDEWP
ncbi:MAG: hypothetical protein GDA46_00770 [Bdellovibrionales bacterium]|nr:hypothetical protein [Bdellovibrionales bacterium]